MRSARIVLPLLAAIAMFAVAGVAGGGEKAPPGSESNPLVAVPNPTPTRIPSDEQPANEAPRQADGRPAEAPKPRSTKTQQGSTALHRSEPMVAPPETPRQHKEQSTSANRPCSLVSKAQARQIIGAPIIDPLEAPQGPTCIYQTASGKPYVTLTVRKTSMAALRDQMRDRREVSVAGRTAYCGTMGGPVLHLPLSDDRVLSLAATCAMAQRFAAAAVERL